MLFDFSHSLAVSFHTSAFLETLATQAKERPVMQFLQKTIEWGRNIYIFQFVKDTIIIKVLLA